MHICTVNKDKHNNPNYLLKMKKIIFILFALIAGTTFAQDNATAVVNAEIVSPIQITSTGPLEFGLIASPNSEETIEVDYSGNRNTISGVTLSGTTPTAASFEINAADTYGYTINLASTDLDISGGDGTKMTLTLPESFSSLGFTATGDGSPQVLTVGGQLTVNKDQPAGDYVGEVSVTVAYQ